MVGHSVHASGSREGKSVEPSIGYTPCKKKLALDSLLFIFIPLEGETKKKETAKDIFFLPKFKEWQHFRDSVGLRNSRRKAEE